jgi:hypothetical protein
MDYAALLSFRQLWKRHLQVAKANAPKTAVNEINQLSEGYPACTRQRARHETEQFHDYPDWQIFDSVAHFRPWPLASPLPACQVRDTRTVTSCEI